MSSRSGDSDIHPDCIQAREDQYRRDIQARNRSPVRNISFDVTELGAIGALFDVPQDESWPPSLELTDHDALSDSANLTTMTADTSTNLSRDPESVTARGSPISRACTPKKCVPYLPMHEYEELQRQKSASKRRRISVSTTVEPGTQDEHDEHDEHVEDHYIEMHNTPFSNHTPSQGSRDLTDKEGCSVKDVGLSSSEPWSQLGRTVGKSVCSGPQPYALHYEGVAE